MNTTTNNILSGKYEVLDHLGSGSFGSVLLVRHTSLDLERAIKIIPRTQVSSISELTEAKLLKSLHHPGLPKIYDIEEDTLNYYLVEEYIQGESLDQFLLRQSFISEKLFFKFCEQLCDIFSYLHSFSPTPILYRDLKPEHIIVCGIQLKLIDFGISSYVTSLGNNFNYLGNVDFSGPESFTQTDISLTADIYSIGQIIKYMMQFLKHPPSSGILHIIQKATQQNPSLRFETVEELHSALKTEFQTSSQPHLHNSIAVVGSHNGCGTTHIAISFVSTLNSLGYSAIYFEKNHAGNLQSASRYQNSLVEQEGFYNYKNFCGLPNYGPGIQLSIPEHTISVYDYGTNLSLNGLLQADVVIYVCNGAIWHWNDAIEKNELLIKSGITPTILCNLCNRRQSVILAKQLQANLYLYPFDEDPFQITKEKEELFLQLLKRKGWSLSFSEKRKNKRRFLRQ